MCGFRTVLAIIVLLSIMAVQTGCEISTTTNTYPAKNRSDWAITNETNTSMANGGTYTGPLINNGDGSRYPHGQGTRNYANGDKYVGHFDNGYLEGEGTYTYANGDMEKGRFSHGGLYTGQIITKNPNGTDKIWEYEDGRLIHSKGTDVSKDGTKYVGEWFYTGQRSGGTINWPDGRTYKGQWRVVEGQQDPPEGPGEMTWPDGRKFVGDFRDGLPDGLGTMTYPNGKTVEGFWKGGVFVGKLVKADQPTSTPTSQTAALR